MLLSPFGDSCVLVSARPEILVCVIGMMSEVRPGYTISLYKLDVEIKLYAEFTFI